MARLAGRRVHSSHVRFHTRLISPIEWEPRPTSPSSIRLIHFGRMLDDKSPLKGAQRSSFMSARR
jgi:hypothetical protein